MGPTWTTRSHREDGKLQQQLNIDKPKLWRKLQVHKSTALGLVVSFANLQLEVRRVDRADQDLKLVIKSEGRVEYKTISQCRFVPLLGKQGWKL